MSGKYRTIVADPPWDVQRPVGGYGGDVERRSAVVAEIGQTRPLDYSTMTVDEIKALPVRAMTYADIGGPDRRPRREAGLPTHEGSHLFLWTTTQYLVAAHEVALAWGFRPSAVLVWCKPTGGLVGGTFYSNVEFVVYGRRGAPATEGKANTRWFAWPRAAHSEKPDAFLRPRGARMSRSLLRNVRPPGEVRLGLLGRPVPRDGNDARNGGRMMGSVEDTEPLGGEDRP